MKIAVLGDIHGNAIALREVLQAVRSQGVGQLLLTGDFAGYYYRVDEVFAELSTWKWEGVQGNHDAIFCHFIAGDEKGMEQYRQRYGSGLDAASRLLIKTQIDLLRALPERRECVQGTCRILLCHGSPWWQDEYIYPNAPAYAFDRIAQLGYDVVIMGHTHWPIVRTVGRTLIINPGSVGQPRDEGSNASWAVLDTDIVSAVIHRARFSPAEVIADATRHDPENKYLIEVLTRVRSPYARF